MLRSRLHGVGATDPFVLVGGALIVLTTSVVATLAPARRVARTPPLEIFQTDSL